MKLPRQKGEQGGAQLRAPVVVSESRALRSLSGILAGVHTEHDNQTLAYVRDKLEQLAANAEMGLHANPALMLYGNPPTSGGLRYVGPLGWIDSFRYRHETEGRREHKFELDDTRIWCATIHDKRVFVISNERGVPVWEDM